METQARTQVQLHLPWLGGSWSRAQATGLWVGLQARDQKWSWIRGQKESPLAAGPGGLPWNPLGLVPRLGLAWRFGKKIEDGENCEGRYLHDFLKG